MNYTEEATSFACAGEMLLGILARPETPAQTGVLVIVGGPQYRVGSHRQFVLLSRTLAAAGYPVLRFDYRGMGDSEGKPRDFLALTADITAAIDALYERVPSLKKVALWGLCDGASSALIYYHETSDPRVHQLCLLNPWVRSEVSLARTKVKHYYAQRLMQKHFWLKLLAGKVMLGAISSLAKDLGMWASGSAWPAPKDHSFQKKMAAAWAIFPGKILLILSCDDYVAKEFLEYASRNPDWKSALKNPNLVRHTLQGADHTFSTAKSRAMVDDLTLSWLIGQTSRSQNDLQ